MSVIRHPSTGTAVTVKQWRYTATGGETTLSGTDGFGLSLSYTVGAEEVYINGVLLVRGTDYTASTGTSITGLTALVAGDVATVMSANSFNVANAIAASTVTAKGDLIVANGAASVSNLPVGADGTTLVANSSSSTGVAWAGPIATAGKNAVINGGMDIWQRGTSSSTLGYATADRWWCNNNGGTSTISQSTTYLPTGLRYALKIVGSGGSFQTIATQVIETANTISLVNQTVTLSAYFAADSSTGMTVNLQYSTSVDNAVTGSWTSITPTSGGSGTVGTAMARVSGVFVVPSSAQSLRIVLSSTGNMAAGVAAYITGVQLELGSIATAFSRAGGTLQGELAACQRYYVQYGPNNVYEKFGIGTSRTSGQADALLYLPVSMRTSPSSINYGGSFAITNAAGGSVYSVTSLSLDTPGKNIVDVYIASSGGFSTGTTIVLYANNSSSAYIGISAEL